MHFADPVDRASAEEERMLQANIRTALQNKPEHRPAKGACYNCDEALADSTRFCDVDCRDDFEARQRSRTVNGLKV